MRKFITRWMAASLVMLLLSACSSGAQGQNPADVKVDLVTDPSPARIMQSVKMTANITGLTNTDGLIVQFDINKSDLSGLSELKYAKAAENGYYWIEKKFVEPGNYTIYIHLYRGDLHLTKKKELTVS